MNKHPDLDELLTKHLRDSHPYLPDDGFTSRVMANIPAPQRSPRWARTLLVGIPAVIVGLLVFGQLPLIETTQQIWQWALTADLLTVLITGAGISGVTLLACLAWLARDMELV